MVLNQYIHNAWNFTDDMCLHVWLNYDVHKINIYIFTGTHKILMFLTTAAFENYDEPEIRTPFSKLVKLHLQADTSRQFPVFWVLVDTEKHKHIVTMKTIKHIHHLQFEILEIRNRAQLSEE